MKNFLLLIFTTICVVGVVVLIYYNQPRKEGRVCFGKNCFTVEIADDTQKRQIGLMYRQSLAQDKGMLFIYNKEDIYPFWMKNTLITLDMIWINQDNEVVFVNKNAEPCGEGECPLITPDSAARYILEINSGLVQELEIKPGDKAEIKY